MEEAPLDQRKRAPAVTLAAWLVIVPASVGAVFAAILASTRSGTPEAVGIDVPDEVTQIAGVVAAIVSIMIGAALIYVGVSLLRLHRWARTVALIIQALWLVTWITLVGGGDVHPVQHLIRLVLPATIVVLLYLPTSIRAFYD